jgi:hypothetical protein
MSVTKAIGDSNASPHNPNQEVNTGGSDVGSLGYTQIPFPSQMPAQKNSDISGTADMQFSMVNQGTSLPSYDEQDETISSESGGGDNQDTSGK